MNYLFIRLQRTILWMLFSIALFFFTSANAQGAQSAIYYHYTSSGQIIVVVCYFYPGGGGYCTTDSSSVRAALGAIGSGGPIGCGNCQPTDFVLAPHDLLNLDLPLPLVNAVKLSNVQITDHSLKPVVQIQQVQEIGQSMLPKHIGLNINTSVNTSLNTSFNSSLNQEMLQSGVRQFR